ncbi:MAG: SAM-dependent methyltransferase [Moraxellaceae bacterium]|jgi:ubiquinone/menaquinone biosynthesis C-methylase UbiE|nr:SAM-dependent methyltransferase [Moraxellaceae bacterium]
MTTDARAGAAVYNRATLLAYDFWVLGVSNRWAWNCPTAALLAHFDRHVGRRHLDIGVGTGYLLDHCRFPAGSPEVVLADLNPASLAAAAWRLRRLRPVTHEVNVLEPFRLPGAPFDSVSMNYLLHCLPGTLADKAPAIRHAAAHLRPDGTLFGATILGEAARHNAFGSLLMRLYNARGIFGNREDTAEALREVLARELQSVEVRVLGKVALFSGRR